MSVDNPATPEKDSAESLPVWEFVRLSEYVLPSVPVTGTARRKWSRLKQIFKINNHEEESPGPFKMEDDLRTLPQYRLEHLIPPINWSGPADALDHTLDGWLEASSSGVEASVKFVIGQPHAGNEEFLRHWAERHGARWIDAPRPEEILKGARDWVADWKGGTPLWVLPHLEHCFLRHANGLELVRHFLDKALNGELGAGLIGCDSWGWAYLQRVCLISHWDAWTLQGFDGKRLARFFSSLMGGARRSRVQFRHAKTGKTIMSIPLGDGEEISGELNHLAARCRGNFGRAIVYWRERLRAEAEKEAEERQKKEEEKEAAEESLWDREEVVWVTDISEDLVLPSEKEEDMGFVLHALLLHNGLPASWLPGLLPLPAYRIMSLLRRLQSMGVVEKCGDRYKVTVAGYGAAREYLAARDYLLDDF